MASYCIKAMRAQMRSFRARNKSRAAGIFETREYAKRTFVLENSISFTKDTYVTESGICLL